MTGTQVVDLDQGPLDSEPLSSRRCQGAFLVLQATEVAEIEARQAAVAHRVGGLGQPKRSQITMARVAAAIADW